MVQPFAWAMRSARSSTNLNRNEMSTWRNSTSSRVSKFVLSLRAFPCFLEPLMELIGLIVVMSDFSDGGGLEGVVMVDGGRQ